MASTTAPPASASGVSARVQVQKFGTFLSNMVMPNIAAFIAWGLITSLFIKVGWLPMLGIGTADDSWVAKIGGWGAEGNTGIVGPMITYLLPLLIGYTGGYNIYKTRGGVVGAIATMGVIAGTSIPMFMGAMLMGPLGGWSIKKIDAIWDGKIRPGFEMLVNNFSAGIWGMVLATAAFFLMSPIFTAIAEFAGSVVDTLVSSGLLPLTSIFIEPAKILFLNNAINHGVLTPLGLDQAADTGKSILFLLEANPGPGLGLLLAYTFFGKGLAKASAPGAAIIHFIGGIHEIYFPYVLAKPRLIIAMIAGGMTQIATNMVFGSGLRAPAAPGSIIAVLVSTASDSYVGVLLSVILGAAATFAVAAVLLKADKSEDDGDLSAATASMESMKGKKSIASSVLAGAGSGAITGPVRSIVFACDAGMGSSAMGASVLRRKVQAAGFTDITVVNKAIANLTDDIDVLVTHQDLANRAAQGAPSATLFTVDNFMASPVYDEIVAQITAVSAPAAVGASVAGGSASAAAPATPVAAPAAAASSGASLLALSSIRLSGTSAGREAAIVEAGQLLADSGAVGENYIAAMLEREQSVSTYMGNLLAIPHGTNEAKGEIRQSALSFVRYPQGIDWGGKPVKFVVGVAGAGDDHLGILANLAKVFLNANEIAALEAATTPEEVHAILGKIEA
ncbi:MAG: PTS mannitol transporter subunit IICBA [Phycicoccus sp.]|nr:PTS mannitol transporter subunit IICBA [Phycicoccus sp.]